MTDLRGDGDSDKPLGDVEHLNYSNRVMSQDQAGVMHRLGFDEFDVMAHDRGARVDLRMALDFPKTDRRLMNVRRLNMFAAFNYLVRRMAYVKTTALLPVSTWYMIGKLCGRKTF